MTTQECSRPPKLDVFFIMLCVGGVRLSPTQVLTRMTSDQRSPTQVLTRVTCGQHAEK